MKLYRMDQVEGLNIPNRTLRQAEAELLRIARWTR